MVYQSGYFSFIVLRTTFFFSLKDLEQYQMMELKKEQEVMQVTYQVFATGTVVFIKLYYYMRNFCNLIGLEQWYFSLI